MSSAAAKSSDISVVIITHNRQKEVLNAVRSAIEQSTQPLEIIIVDDGSTPAMSLGALLGGEHGIPIRIVRKEVAGGPSAARNTGMRAAKGSWIAFLDDDDEFEPRKIATLTETIARLGTSVDLIYHPARILMVNEGVEYISAPQAPISGSDFFQELLVKNVIGGTPMVVGRKEKLLASGGFDESLRALEDYELWIRLARDGAQFYLLPEPLTRYHYTTAKASITKSDAAGLETFKLISRSYGEQFDKLPPARKQEHFQWVNEIVLHRAILRLEYAATMRAAMLLLVRFKRIKYAAALISSIFGPKFIIKLRAWRSAS